MLLTPPNSAHDILPHGGTNFLYTHSSLFQCGSRRNFSSPSLCLCSLLHAYIPSNSFYFFSSNQSRYPPSLPFRTFFDPFFSSRQLSSGFLSSSDSHQNFATIMFLFLIGVWLLRNSQKITTVPMYWSSVCSQHFFLYVCVESRKKLRVLTHFWIFFGFLVLHWKNQKRLVFFGSGYGILLLFLIIQYFP